MLSKRDPRRACLVYHAACKRLSFSTAQAVELTVLWRTCINSMQKQYINIAIFCSSFATAVVASRSCFWWFGVSVFFVLFLVMDTHCCTQCQGNKMKYQGLEYCVFGLDVPNLDPNTDHRLTLTLTPTTTSPRSPCIPMAALGEQQHGISNSCRVLPILQYSRRNAVEARTTVLILLCFFFLWPRPPTMYRTWPIPPTRFE